MLQLSATFIQRPVLSLRTGSPIATATAPLINPDNLKIEGFYCEDSFDKSPLILVAQDIRDLLPQGIVVDDHDVLAEASELVRLAPVIDLQFELLGKPVVTASKTKVGKVSDYAVETDSLIIKKIYVSQSVFKNFAGGSLSIDRTQVIEITPKHIVIDELTKKVPAGAAMAA